MSALPKLAIPAALDTLPQSEAGVQFPLLHPGTLEPLVDDGVPLTLTLQGADSEAWNNAGLEIERRNREKGGNDKPNPVHDICDRLARVTKEWSGFRDEAGKPAACTRELAEQLYRGSPEVRDQALVLVTRRANFIKGSPKG
jgi:hypothetical protein